jgi:hypothetical protein
MAQTKKLPIFWAIQWRKPEVIGQVLGNGTLASHPTEKLKFNHSASLSGALVTNNKSSENCNFSTPNLLYAKKRNLKFLFDKSCHLE